MVSMKNMFQSTQSKLVFYKLKFRQAFRFFDENFAEFAGGLDINSYDVLVQR